MQVSECTRAKSDGSEERTPVRPHDEYSTAIDHAVADAVRATLVVPHASVEGAHELRLVTTRLSDAHGHVAVRDLAEALAADMAELLGAFAQAHQCDPLALLDEWTHDARGLGLAGRESQA
jgi:hypothetical protein